MAIYKCKMCGGQLEVEGSVGVCTCDYCGAQQTLPKSLDENIQGLFNRANVLRMKAEFDKASEIYEKILNANEEEAEAYWGLILCKYGIEYVEDPKTFQRVPTCHRASFEAVTADEDFKMALKYSDSIQKSIYETEAAHIDDIQKGIISLAQKEDSYDVFICYKETDTEGKRTQDSVIANDIYYQLTQEGYKVFYAAITLEDKLGQEYEPYIFSALTTARVMLVVGTKPEYYNAVWVKNEWSRFMKIMKTDHSRVLIPCYKDMDAYELPEEFAHLQAQDMSKIGFINDLVRGIKKIIVKPQNGSDNNANTENAQQIITQINGNSVALVQRGNMALEDGEWDSAYTFFEDALNFDAQNAEAYLGKMMTNMHIRSIKELKNVKKSFEDDSNYKKAIRFGSQALIEELNECISAVNERVNQAIYDEAKEEMENERFSKALELYKKIAGFRDADSLAEECERISVENKAKQESENARDESIMDAIRTAINNKHVALFELQKEIDSLSAEKNSLSIFAGKRKKEIDDSLSKLLTQKKGLTDINIIKSKGTDTEYIEAMNNLEDQRIREKFSIKYPGAYLAYNNPIIEVGARISFGRYNNEPIIWRILNINDNRALIITDKIIDALPYTRGGLDPLWERSYIRNWLNRTFFESSFDDGEKKIIKKVILNKQTGVEDKAFLLSNAEASTYLKSNNDRIGLPTEFAKTKAERAAVEPLAWWLRVTEKDIYADAVLQNGNLLHKNDKIEVYANWGVRPALYINISI